MLRAGQTVVLAAIALLVFGVVMVNSALMEVAPIGAEAQTSHSLFESILLGRSTIYMLLALIAMVVAQGFPFRRMADAMIADARVAPAGTAPDRSAARVRARDLLILLVAMATILVLISMSYWPVIGRTINYSTRWIGVRVGASDIRMQPSEVAKWGLVALIAWYAARNAQRLRSFWTGLMPPLAAAGLVAGAVLIEDLGTGVLIAAVACLVLLGAGARFWHFLALAPGGVTLLAYAILSSDYRRERLTAFIDPFADPRDSGYHMIQSMAAVAGGGGPGRGLGHGLQKFGYLPEDSTDFLFAIVCEELGIVGAAAVVGLLGIMLWAILAVVKREPNPILRLFALGVMGTIGLQAVINLMVVTGLGPTKGIALPLVSSGGTGWILTGASLGVIASIDRSQPREPVIAHVEPASA